MTARRFLLPSLFACVIVTVLLYSFWLDTFSAFSYYIKLHPERQLPLNEGFDCPKGPIVTVMEGGRLANQIFEYGSAYFVAKYLNRSAYIPASIMKTLVPLFGHLTFKTTLEVVMLKCNITLDLTPASRTDFIFLGSAGLDLDKYKSVHVVLPKYIFLQRVMNKHINEFRQEFRFRSEILEKVSNTIESIGGKNKTLVGVHVRRTDYKRYLSGHNETLVNETYFKNAMQYFRDKYPEHRLLFLIVSDDMKWSEENLSNENDVRMASVDPVHDLALLSVCNHTITDYGTYGAFGSFMSSGHKVMVNVQKQFCFLEQNYNWTFFDKDTLLPT